MPSALSLSFLILQVEAIVPTSQDCGDHSMYLVHGSYSVNMSFDPPELRKTRKSKARKGVIYKGWEEKGDSADGKRWQTPGDGASMFVVLSVFSLLPT